MDFLDGGMIVGFLALWKLTEKFVDAQLAKRNNKNGNPGNPGRPIVCPYENSAAIKNSLNNIDQTFNSFDKSMTSVKDAVLRIERKLET